MPQNIDYKKIGLYVKCFRKFLQSACEGARNQNFPQGRRIPSVGCGPGVINVMCPSPQTRILFHSHLCEWAWGKTCECAWGKSRHRC